MSEQTKQAEDASVDDLLNTLEVEAASMGAATVAFSERAEARAMARVLDAKQSLRAYIASLRAENERLKEDAARLDFLDGRKGWHNTQEGYVLIHLGAYTAGTPLRDMIDSARGSEQ